MGNESCTCAKFSNSDYCFNIIMSFFLLFIDSTQHSPVTFISFALMYPVSV